MPPENIPPNPTPAPGSEVANVFGAPPPGLDAGQEAPPPAEYTPEPTSDAWKADEWAKQTVNLDTPAPEATPSLGQQAPAEQKPAPPPQGFVPQQALAEARGETKDLQAKIERMNQRFEDTIRLLQGRMAGQDQPQPAAQVPALPDAEQEPVKHMTARFERLEQALNSLINMNQQNVGQQQAVQQIQAAEMAFKAEHGDYDNALNYVRARRTKELTGALGLSPQQAAQALAQEEMMIAGNALRRGDSPASAVYKLAQEWGFKANNGNGQTAEQAQQAAAAVQKIATAQQGVAASKTLGQVAGQSASVGMTLEALADIQDPVEFSKAFDKLMGNQRAQRSQLPGFLRR